MKITDVQSPYVFISYAHKNTTTVKPILTAMETAGFRLWYDKGIEVGTEWPANIEAHLRAASAVVVFMSNDTVESKNCRNEINLAITCGKDILVAYLEDTELRHGLGLQLGTTQSIFFERHGTVDSFVNELKKTSFLIPCLQAKEPEPKESAAVTPPTEATVTPPTEATVTPPTEAASRPAGKLRTPSPSRRRRNAPARDAAVELYGNLTGTEILAHPTLVVALGGTSCEILLTALPSLHAALGDKLSAFFMDVDPHTVHEVGAHLDEMNRQNGRTLPFRALSLGSGESFSDILAYFEEIDEKDKHRCTASNSASFAACTQRRDGYFAVAYADKTGTLAPLADEFNRLLTLSEGTPQVFLITSLGGNFGSGALLPLSQFFNKLLPVSEFAPFVTAFLTTPDLVDKQSDSPLRREVMQGGAYATLKELCGVCSHFRYTPALPQVVGKLHFFESYRQKPFVPVLTPHGISHLILAPKPAATSSLRDGKAVIAEALVIAVRLHRAASVQYNSMMNNQMTLRRQADTPPPFPLSSVEAAAIAYPQSLLSEWERKAALPAIDGITQLYQQVFDPTTASDSAADPNLWRKKLIRLRDEGHPFMQTVVQSLAQFGWNEDGMLLPLEVENFMKALRACCAEAAHDFLYGEEKRERLHLLQASCQKHLVNGHGLLPSARKQKEQKKALDPLFREIAEALSDLAKRYLNKADSLASRLAERELDRMLQLLLTTFTHWNDFSSLSETNAHHPGVAYLLMRFAKEEIRKTLLAIKPLELTAEGRLSHDCFLLPWEEPQKKGWKKSAYYAEGAERFTARLSGNAPRDTKSDPYYDLDVLSHDIELLGDTLCEKLLDRLYREVLLRVLSRLDTLLESYAASFKRLAAVANALESRTPHLAAGTHSLLSDDEMRAYYEDLHHLGITRDYDQASLDSQAGVLFFQEAFAWIEREELINRLFNGATYTLRTALRKEVSRPKCLMEWLHKKHGDNLFREIQALINRATPASYRSHSLCLVITERDAAYIKQHLSDLKIPAPVNFREVWLTNLVAKCNLERTSIRVDGTEKEPVWKLFFSASFSAPDAHPLLTESVDNPYYTAYRSFMKKQREGTVTLDLHLLPEFANPSVLPDISPASEARYLEDAALALLYKLISGSATVARENLRPVLTSDVHAGTPLISPHPGDRFTEERLQTLLDDREQVEALAHLARETVEDAAKTLPVVVSPDDIDRLIHAMLALPVVQALCGDLNGGKEAPVNLPLLAYSAKYSKSECFVRYFTAERLLMAGLRLLYDLVNGALFSAIPNFSTDSADSDPRIHIAPVYHALVEAMLKPILEGSLPATDKNRILKLVEQVAYTE